MGDKEFSSEGLSSQKLNTTVKGLGEMREPKQIAGRQTLSETKYVVVDFRYVSSVSFICRLAYLLKEKIVFKFESYEVHPFSYLWNENVDIYFYETEK